MFAHREAKLRSRSPQLQTTPSRHFQVSPKKASCVVARHPTWHQAWGDRATPPALQGPGQIPNPTVRQTLHAPLQGLRTGTKWDHSTRAGGQVGFSCVPGQSCPGAAVRRMLRLDQGWLSKSSGCLRSATHEGKEPEPWAPTLDRREGAQRGRGLAPAAQQEEGVWAEGARQWRATEGTR